MLSCSYLFAERFQDKPLVNPLFGRCHGISADANTLWKRDCPTTRARASLPILVWARTLRQKAF